MPPSASPPPGRQDVWPQPQAATPTPLPACPSSLESLTPLLKQEWCRKLKPLAGARQPRQHRHFNFCDPGTSVPSLISRHDATVRYTYCGIQLPWKHQLIWTLKHGSQEWLRPRAFCLVYKTLASRCKRAFCISGLILTQNGTNLRRK